MTEIVIEIEVDRDTGKRGVTRGEKTVDRRTALQQV